MSSKPLTLVRIREELLQWTTSHQHGTYAYRKGLPGDWQNISAAELGALDARLPLIVEELTSTQSWVDAGENLQRTVIFWDKPLTPLPEMIGQGRQYIDKVISIDKVVDDTIYFTAQVFYESCTQGIPFISGFARYYLTESIDWLHTHYPEAKSRVIAGMGVDMPQWELVRYVFDKAPSRLGADVQVDLPNVGFDTGSAP